MGQDVVMYKEWKHPIREGRNLPAGINGRQVPVHKGGSNCVQAQLAGFAGWGMYKLLLLM